MMVKRVDDLTDEEGNLNLSGLKQAREVDGDTLTLLKDQVEELESVTTELETVTKELSGERDGITIQFGDLGFTQEADANAYLELHGYN